jgi:hypothetical protein
MFRLRWLTPKVGYNSPLERIVRMVALAAVFVLVAWGFSANMERRMDSIGVRGQIQDNAELLSIAERKNLEAIAERFQKRFELRLEIRILTAPFHPDSWDEKSILLVLNPEAAQVIFTAPPLIRRAMGEAFLAEVGDTFAPAFIPANQDYSGEPGSNDSTELSWQEALFKALSLVERKLIELTS